MKEGWKVVPFEDTLQKVRYTNKVKSTSFSASGSFPIVSQEKELVSGYWEDATDVFSVTKPVVIFGDHTKVVKYVDFSFVLGADGVKIMLPIDSLDSKFFYYFMKSVELRDLGYARHYRILKEKYVPIPSILEQQCIVSILDQAFEKIDVLKANAEKNLADAQVLFQQSLKEEFQLRTSWSLRKLGELGTFKNGMNFAHNESGFDLHLLGVGDFKDYFSIEDTNNLQLLSLNQQPSEEYLLQNDDIVFVRSNGNKQLVGRSVVVYPNNTPTTFSGFCIRFRKSVDDLDIRYLVSFLKQPDTRKKLFGNGTNISNLNQRALNDLDVPLPPLKEQNAIADKICQLTTLCGEMQLNYQQTITQCDALKQAILRQAFNGEL